LDSYIKFYMSIKLPKEHEFIVMYRQFMLVNDYQFFNYHNEEDEETDDQDN
jgi:hypothetical protein